MTTTYHGSHMHFQVNDEIVLIAEEHMKIVLMLLDLGMPREALVELLTDKKMVSEENAEEMASFIIRQNDDANAAKKEREANKGDGAAAEAAAVK
jgi:hypothetical protein